MHSLKHAPSMVWKSGIKVFMTWMLSCVSLFSSTTTSTPKIFDTQKENPPNILFFLVDDMGWQDTSVPFWEERTPFNDHFQTPSMEILARQGKKFTNAYACAVCSPSRTSWMTGMNAARHRVTNWTLYADKETSHKTPTLQAPADWNRSGLQPHPDLLPQLLKSQLGYRTIHAGKAHWGAFDTPGSDPKNLGFDVNIAGHSAGGPGHYHGESNYGNEEKGGYTKPWGIPGLEKYHGSDTHLTDALTLEAIEAVRGAVEADQPFFLYMAHYAVHAPIRPHQRFLSDYLGKNYPGTDIPIPQAEAYYASMVEGMDASLGELMDAFESMGVAEDTIIIFASDNGGLSKHARGKTPRNTGQDTHCWPLREGKGSAYEGGTRIPFIVSWAQPNPNHPLQRQLPIPSNAVSSTPIIIEDIYQTICNWMGLKPNERSACEIDGKDWTSALVAECSASQVADELKNRPLIFHYPHQWTGTPVGGYQPHSTIRLGDWKAIYYYESKTWELYHLSEDIGETQNLAEEDPERLHLLATRLVQELEDKHAQWPAPLKDDSAQAAPMLP